MDNLDQLDRGVMVEGDLERSDKNGHFMIRFEDHHGKVVVVDVTAALELYVNTKMRFILTPSATIDKIEEMMSKTLKDG